MISFDCFVRASFFLSSIAKTYNMRGALASVFSLIRDVSVPYGFEIEGYPILSTTRLRMVADQKNLVYHFEVALRPNAFWVDLKKIDFSGKAAIPKPDLSNQQTYSGETSGYCKESAPFRFIGF
ncbi:linear amide C-N hydrolase [Cyclobacterium xiamenense]